MDSLETLISSRSRDLAISAIKDMALRSVRIEGAASLTPGSAFGPSGERHVRMAYCVDDDVINVAFDRMERHFGT